MKICKKYNIQMEVKNPQVKRRGNEQSNMLSEYHGSKCDHCESDESILYLPF